MWGGCLLLHAAGLRWGSIWGSRERSEAARKAGRSCCLLSHTIKGWTKGKVFLPVKGISCAVTHRDIAELLHLVLSVPSLMCKERENSKRAAGS